MGTFTCPTCGKIFERNKKGAKFCSRKCVRHTEEVKAKIRKKVLELGLIPPLGYGIKFEKGRKPTEEEKAKRLKTIKGKGTYDGSNNPMWKGGVTPLITKLRLNRQYKNWRKAVYERDDYTCQVCGNNKGGNLEAHHIISFSFLLKESQLLGNFKPIYDVENGLTLCKDCHKKTNNYGINTCIEESLFNVLYLLWKVEKQGTADEFYKRKMEEVIEHFKTKLP